MAKASKLSSGNWRVRTFYIDDAGNKIRKSFTASTKKEAEFLAQSFLYQKKNESADSQTLRDAIDEYIRLKDGVLSPTTILDYKRMKKHYTDKLLNKQLRDITKIDIDEWIKRQSEICSSKTVRNRYGFLHRIFKYNDISIEEHRLPEKKRIKYKLPKDNEIKLLINYAKEIHDDELLIIIMFGAFGCMRRGEMCGVVPDDLCGTVLHIHRNKVQCEHGTVIKAPKNLTSDRYIEVPMPMLKVMQGKNAYITSSPNTVSRKFKRALKACRLPSYRLHDLRHYCASVLHSNGVPNVYIQKFGGWKDETVLNAIYRNAMEDYEMMYSNRMSKLFDDIAN